MIADSYYINGEKTRALALINEANWNANGAWLEDPFRWAEKTFVVAVHEFLQATVCVQWKVKFSNSLDPVQRRRIALKESS